MFGLKKNTQYKKNRKIPKYTKYKSLNIISLQMLIGKNKKE